MIDICPICENKTLEKVKADIDFTHEWWVCANCGNAFYKKKEEKEEERK